MSPQPKAAKEPFIFSTINRAGDAYPVTRLGSWADLVQHVEKNVQMIPLTEEEYAALPDKERKPYKDGPAFILGEFDGYRSEEKMRAVFGAGFDFDSGNPSLDAIRNCLNGLAAIIYETASSKSGQQRWRVIVPYSRGLSTVEAREQWEVLAERFPKAWLEDESGHDPSRLWFGRVRFKDGTVRRMETLAGSPHEPAMRTRKLSPKEALLKNIKTPTDAPESEGGRNTQLSRYCASLLSRSIVQSEAELLAALLEQGSTYSPPYGDSAEEAREIRTMARNKWKRRSKFNWQPLEREGDDEPAFFLDIGRMSETQPVGPHWVIPNWLPGRTVTLYSGDGGSGKSFCSLDMAVCVALGIDLFGYRIERQRVMLVSAEDDENVLHWRIARICQKYGRKMGELVGWLHLRDASGDDNVLFTDNKFTGAEWKARRDVLLDHFNEAQCKLLILDNASDHYDANENERAKVRQFITGLSGCLDEDEAVLLLAHVDANTALNPEQSKGYSGSTAWNNSVRSRWFQYRDKDSGKVTLKLAKSNYAQAGESVPIEFDQDRKCYTLGVAEKPLASLNKFAGLILTLIHESSEAGVTISPAPTARNNPYTVLHKDSRFPKGGSKNQINDLIRTLIQGQFLVVEKVPQRNGKVTQQLALTERGRAHMVAE